MLAKVRVRNLVSLVKKKPESYGWMIYQLAEEREALERRHTTLSNL